jgi:hypothetical protein
MKAAIQILTILLVFRTVQLYGEPNESPPPIPSQENAEVLNEGPIHEAFAQPVDLNPQAGIVSPNEPPPDIVENPASEKPKGSEYVWIPGYWGWDPAHKDYIWISGCWRKPPANMSWIPGYWNKVSGGWQWVSGFWIPTSRADQIEYLPEPPEIENVEPPVESTTTENIWVPPCYRWYENHYILQPGYWLEPNNDWIWIPSHYTWTPYGYVFVQGYWDHVLTARGILYAPVYFPRHFHRSPGYRFSLGVVVDIANLQFSLFSYPHYCHYFFGDYYGDFYINLGIYPWFEFETRHSWYDPIFTYDRWHYRKTIPHWSKHIRHEYDLRLADKNLRPPRTYHQLETRLSKIPANRRNEFRNVRPLRNYIESKNAPFKFSRMNEGQHKTTFSHANKVNNFRNERMHLESGHRILQGTHQPSESGTHESETHAKMPSTPSVRQQAKSGGGQREIHTRGTSMKRSSSERRNISRSPVSDRGYHGLFGHRTPSRPQREKRFDHSENRRSSGGRRHR